MNRSTLKQVLLAAGAVAVAFVGSLATRQPVTVLPANDLEVVRASETDRRVQPFATVDRGAEISAGTAAVSPDAAAGSVIRSDEDANRGIPDPIDNDTGQDPVAQFDHAEADDDERDTRAGAVRQLATASTSEALPALTHVLRTDPHVTNRLLAVNSLRILALRGGSKSAIGSILREAMSDPDENVAAHARAAYEELAASR